MKHLFCQLTIIISFASLSTAIAQTQAIKNDGDKPQGLVEVYMDGNPVAGLYVLPGETMRVKNQNPISGAGYYQALPNNYFPVQAPDLKPVTFEGNVCFPKLRVDKVEWDHNGQLKTITGLRPVLYMELTTNIAIISAVNTPKIANGNLYIKLDGRGEAEYWVKIQYGKIVAIGKHQDTNSSASVKALATDASYRAVSPDDGFYFNAYPDGDWEITEPGTISAKVKRITLLNKSRKEFDVDLTSDEITNGRLNTKQFGVLKIKYEGSYWTFYASENQIKKMQAFLASQP